MVVMFPSLAIKPGVFLKTSMMLLSLAKTVPCMFTCKALPCSCIVGMFPCTTTSFKPDDCGERKIVSTNFSADIRISSNPKHLIAIESGRNDSDIVNRPYSSEMAPDSPVEFASFATMVAYGTGVPSNEETTPDNATF